MTAIGRASPHEEAWRRVIQSTPCDRALTIGPWLQGEFRPVWRSVPAVHLFEEDLTRVEELAPQSLQARLSRRLEWLLERLSRAQPAHVVAISEPERGRAARRFPCIPRSRVDFGLDRREWPVFNSVASGDDVVVVGNFAERRNAEGLAEVCNQISVRRVPLVLRVVSGPGIHASLAPFLHNGTLVHESDPDSMPEAYRRAWASLVPARVVTGQKTTILQAWACGVPVVASAETAATVAADDALLAASDAIEMIEALLRLQNDVELRTRLATAGLDAVEARHTTTSQFRAVQELLDAVGTRAARPYSGGKPSRRSGRPT